MNWTRELIRRLKCAHKKSPKTREISQREYEADFQLSSLASHSDATAADKRKEALRNALDIRKFEIELYWKRATYFWAFIAATFAGYGAVRAAKEIAPQVQTELSIMLSCLGIVFSFGWVCANKGSKQWQENWENHVDMLEDDIMGPLYKTVLKREKAKGIERIRRVITGPSNFSVSKINQIISFFVTLLWVLLLLKALPPIRYFTWAHRPYSPIVILTSLMCLAFLLMGRTHERDYSHTATKRRTRILMP